MRSISSALLPARSSNRWLAGVAGGIADRLGIEPVYVRVAFVIFGLVGFVVYLLLLALTVDTPVDSRPATQEATPDRKAALLLMAIGGLLLAREVGLVPGMMIPIGLVLFGAAALWDRSTPAGRSQLTRLVAPGIGGAPTVGRTIGGVVLLVIGLAVLLSGIDVVQRAGWLLVGALVTAAGAALVFGPWLYRLGKELTAERSQRIRADARAEVAAHLHDSVLQTLALIQRAADDPRRMVTLARRQERELRNWLYRDASTDEAELEAAVARAASKVESDHDVPIEVIVVGSAAVDEDVRALVGAIGEAMVNAAKHSGADLITVYVEVGPDAIEAWVTDQGIGFDTAAASGAGVGIAGSIVGRMQRHSGTATINSGSDGTEVHLRLPTREAAQ